MITRRVILIVSDRSDWIDAATVALDAAGFVVAATQATPSVREAYAEAPHDLAVIDTLGDGDGAGWAVAEDLAGWRRILVVDGSASIRRAFALGAEDCIADGAHVGELVARCEAVLRRSAVAPTDAPADHKPTAVYVDRRLWVNLESRQVWVRGEPSHLTPREFRLLAYLIANRDTTLDHDAILEAVWRRKAAPDRQTEVLKQYIWRLRQKIEADPDRPTIVVTDPGAGYRFASSA